LSFEAALAIQSEAEKLLAGAEYEVPSPPVLELVRESTCSADDCEFVVLARQLGTQLVTMDQRLLREFPQDTRPLVRLGRS
jgi:hypothetical protein